MLQRLGYHLLVGLCLLVQAAVVSVPAGAELRLGCREPAPAADFCCQPEVAEDLPECCRTPVATALGEPTPERASASCVRHCCRVIPLSTRTQPISPRQGGENVWRIAASAATAAVIVPSSSSAPEPAWPVPRVEHGRWRLHGGLGTTRLLI